MTAPARPADPAPADPPADPPPADPPEPGEATAPGDPGFVPGAEPAQHDPADPPPADPPAEPTAEEYHQWSRSEKEAYDKRLTDFEARQSALEAQMAKPSSRRGFKSARPTQQTTIRVQEHPPVPPPEPPARRTKKLRLFGRKRS